MSYLLVSPYGVILWDSVSLLRFLFLSHDEVFCCEISLICRMKCPYSSCFFVVFFSLFLFSGYFTSCEVFGTCVSWWLLTGVWVTASLLRSHDCISAYLNNAVVSIFPLISSSSSLFQTFGGSFQVYHLRLVPPSSPCFTGLFFFSSQANIYLFLFSVSGPPEQQRPLDNNVFL